MSQAWAPVITTAIIVLGVVGGRITHTLVKKIIPLLETLVKERQKSISPADAAALRQRIEDLECRIGDLQGHDHRLGEMEERVQFLQSLLEGRNGSGRIPTSAAGGGRLGAAASDGAAGGGGGARDGAAAAGEVPGPASQPERGARAATTEPPDQVS